MVLSALQASQPPQAIQDTIRSTSTTTSDRSSQSLSRTHNRKKRSPRSSSTSSSQPSTQPSEIFDHDHGMISPSTSVPVSDGYEEEIGKGQMLRVDIDGLEEEDDFDDDTNRVTLTSTLTARPMPGAAVPPMRLAKLANAFGVSTPLPPLGDAHSPHQFGFAPVPPHSPHSNPNPHAHGHSRSTATRFLIHVIPPLSLAPDPSAEAQLKRGALVPLHSTLKGQLGAVAREYKLPSTNPETGASGMAGPRISDDAWRLLWQPLLRMEREELAAALTSPRSASVASHLPPHSHSPVPSPPNTLRDSPVDDSAVTSPSASISSDLAHAQGQVLRPLNTGAGAGMGPSPRRQAFPFGSGRPSPLDSHHPSGPGSDIPEPRIRQDSLASLASTASSHPSRPPYPSRAAYLSRPSTSLSLSVPSPIVGKVEFDIDRSKAGWFDLWLARTRGGSQSAAPSPSPGVRGGPLPLMLPSRANSRATSRSPRSPLFRLDGDSPLPSAGMLRSEDGLLSPGSGTVMGGVMHELEPELFSHELETPEMILEEDTEEGRERMTEPEYVQLEDEDGDAHEQEEVEEEDVTLSPEEEAELTLSPEEEVELDTKEVFETRETSEEGEIHTDGSEEQEEKELGPPTIPFLSISSDPLGDVFPADGETWSTLRSSISSNAAQPANSHRSSLSAVGIQGLGIRMNGMPYSPAAPAPPPTRPLPPSPVDAVRDDGTDEEGHMLAPLAPPSPGRFDDGSGSGSGTDWDSTDDVEDVVSLWNAKHGQKMITQAQLREELRDSLRHPVTVVEVSRDDAEADGREERMAFSPEPIHSPETVTPGGSPRESMRHSRIPSNSTATGDSPVGSGSGLSPPAPQGKRSAPPAPLRLAPSPHITDRVIDREPGERDSLQGLPYTRLQKTTSRASSNRQSSVDSEADSLRASQIRMQKELDDIEKAYAQISPKPGGSSSLMDLTISPDLSTRPSPAFPGLTGKSTGLVVGGWPAIPVSPTVAQQGVDGLMAPGIMGPEDRPFAPATVSIETLQRARSAEEEGINISPKDKKDRRSTKSPSIERNESVRSRDSSRFSEESSLKDVKTERKRSQSIMSVKSIRRLWKKGAQAGLQDVPEAESPPLPPPTPKSPMPPSPYSAIDLTSPRISTSSADSISDFKDGKRDSGLDHFRFDQDSRLSLRSPTPVLQAHARVPSPSQSTNRTSLKAARTRSVLNKWASPKVRQQPTKEPEDDGGVRIHGRSVLISAPMHVIHGQADIRDARFAATHRAAPSPPQMSGFNPSGSPTPPMPPPKSPTVAQDSTPPARPMRDSAAPPQGTRESPPRPTRQTSIRRKPVPGMDEVGEDGLLITHSPASSISRAHRTGSISASLLSQPVQEEQQPRPSMSSSTTDDPLSPTELSNFEIVTPVGYAHIRSSPAF